jgi:cytoskeletal protein CcmA (bactofilin family)
MRTASKGDGVMTDETKKTIIENGTEIDGSIKSDRPIVLSGSMKGQILAPSLEVTASGTIKGTVKVNQFSCHGEVGGEVTAETVELAGSVCDATVIRAKSLDVKLAQGSGGVQVSFGNCELQVGELPARPNAKSTGTARESSKETSKVAAASHSVPTEVVDAVSELIK